MAALTVKTRAYSVVGSHEKLTTRYCKLLSEARAVPPLMSDTNDQLKYSNIREFELLSLMQHFAMILKQRQSPLVRMRIR